MRGTLHAFSKASSTLLTALLWLLLAFACSVGHVGAAQVQAANSREPKTYLFPILRFGPNNQKRDLRHTLALAKHLGCGVILTGIYKHYLDIAHSKELSDAQQRVQSVTPGSQQKGTNHTDPPPCFKERIPHFMEMSEILDTQAISRWVPTTTVSELRDQEGWNGQLDAVIYTQNWWHLGRRDVDKTLRATGVQVAKTAEHIRVPKPLNCNATLITELKRNITRHKYVGVVYVLLKDSERPRINSEPTTEPTDMCKRASYQADRLLRPAPWITRLVETYTETYLGHREPYLAVHIRPYPDTCLERMKAVNVTRVFVLTHPVIRDVVDYLLKQVEEQVAVRAKAFLGTSLSTITHTIAFERMGRGTNDNVYFESLTKC